MKRLSSNTLPNVNGSRPGGTNGADILPFKSPQPATATNTVASPVPEIIPFDLHVESLRNNGDHLEPRRLNRLAIRLAPAGGRVDKGYDVWAVKSMVDPDDGEENFAEIQPLSGKIADSQAAHLVALAHAYDHTDIKIEATHIIVNNEVGDIVHRIPLLEQEAA